MVGMGRPRSFDRDVALEQAMRLFWEKGYDETSIGDLTAAMGIAAPSLYAAFGDKRALFEEAVELYERLPGAPIAAGEGEPTAFGAVRRMLECAAVEYSLPEQPKGCLIISEPLLEERRAVSRDAIRARLEAGRAAHEFPDGTDVDALAAYVSAVMAGMSARARDGASREDLAAIAEIALRAWPALNA
jgi:AcrR family transcriptional regulator